MATEFISVLREGRLFLPPESIARRAHIRSLEEYRQLYNHSIVDPEGFWAQQAEEHLEWIAPWTSVVDSHWDRVGRCAEPYVTWFQGGRLNVSANCLDRHLRSWRRTKAAIIWQGEQREEKRTLTYQQLHREVCRFANVLKKHGVRKGTMVTLFMPMIPELPIAMLACARLGAVHSVVFSAFSRYALRDRIQDCDSEVVITADAGWHGGRLMHLKESVDAAVRSCPTVRRVIVFNRTNSPVEMVGGRDYWWHEEMTEPDILDDCPCEVMEAEDPLYLLYTSGSTGKPKGVVHTTAGYLLYTHLTFRTIFDYRDEDVYWCTADIGWVTGHSYGVYGPLSNGATSVMYEGAPTYPLPDRFWEIVAEYQVNTFYTAPTAIRAMMRLGEDWPARHDLTSLRLLGTVGEPINPEAWMWYYQTIGGERCPIVDTWWQTETGGIMITTLPGAHPMKPGSAGVPFFGVVPEILDENGSPTDCEHGGSLCIAKPWPGMIRAVYGDPRNERIAQTYFSKFPGYYLSGDSCRRDEEGYYWLMGRMDDVINVAAHRFSTAEIESALVAHPVVAEAAVVGVPHETKGQGIYCFVTLKQGIEACPELSEALIAHVREQISPIATPHRIQFAQALPKTRSGKIMRRILKCIAVGDRDAIGDTSTLADPSVVDLLFSGARTL